MLRAKWPPISKRIGRRAKGIVSLTVRSVTIGGGGATICTCSRAIREIGNSFEPARLVFHTTFKQCRFNNEPNRAKPIIIVITTPDRNRCGRSA